MTMGNMWAFPSATMSYDTTLEAMKALASRIARLSSDCREIGHPLDIAHVLEPQVAPQVWAMIQLQLLTGMRPGEACALRPCDIDRSGPVWLYRPPQHKTGWRGKARVIAIGPKAQAVLATFTPPVPSDHYFSPRRAVARLHAARAAARKTPRYPSHVARNARVRVAAPKRLPAEKYDGTAYGHAVTRAVEKANERRERTSVTPPPLAPTSIGVVATFML